MSFFKKIKSDAISFSEKKRSKDFKGKKKSLDPDSASTIYFNKCDNLHFGNSYTLSATTIINEQKSDGKCQEDNFSTSIPREVEDNFSRIEEVTLEQFLIVCHNMKSGWKKLGHKLGFSNHEMEEYSSAEEDILRMLINWKKAETRQATVGRLIKCLWEVQEFDAAKRLSDDIQCHNQ